MRIIVAAIVIISTFSIGAVSVDASQMREIVVIKGDNISRIAKAYKVPFRIAYALNKDRFKDPNLIYPGDTVLLPSVAKKNKATTNVANKNDKKALVSMKITKSSFAGTAQVPSHKSFNIKIPLFHELRIPGAGAFSDYINSNLLKGAHFNHEAGLLFGLFLAVLSLELFILAFWMAKSKRQLCPADGVIESQGISKEELRRIADEFMRVRPGDGIKDEKCPSGEPEAVIGSSQDHMREFFATAKNSGSLVLFSYGEEKQFVGISELSEYIITNYGYPKGVDSKLYDVPLELLSQYDALDDSHRREIVKQIRANNHIRVSL